MTPRVGSWTVRLDVSHLAHAEASSEHWVRQKDLTLVPLGLYPTPVEVGSFLSQIRHCVQRWRFPLPLPQGIKESFQKERKKVFRLLQSGLGKPSRRMECGYGLHRAKAVQSVAQPSSLALRYRDGK